MIAQLQAEYLKTKRTPTIWFTIGSALFLPVIIFLIHLFRHKYYIPHDNVNPWLSYFKMHFSFIAGLFFPFYLVLSAALNLNIEHKTHSWKKLFLLPINRANFFLYKGLFLLLQTIFALLLFFIGMLFFGYLVGIIHPELQLLKHTPEFGAFLWILTRLLIASLAILSIHYVLSSFLSNIILPITLGIAFTITALIITPNWQYAIYFPYSFPGVLLRVYTCKTATEMWWGLTISEWSSVIISVFVMLIGVWFFRKKQLR